MQQKLEIIATLGPSVKHKISDLIRAGVTAFRLNCSHLTLESVSFWLLDLEKAFKKSKHVLPLWLDIQGAKLRIGKLIHPMVIEKGMLYAVVNGYSQIENEIPLPHKAIFKSINEDDKISLDDGRIIFSVETVDDNQFLARALNSGELNSYKGFNKEGYEVSLKEISSRDLTFIEQTRDYENIGYAISYVQSDEEIKMIRTFSYDSPLIAKIERLKTFDNLHDIADCADGLWLCRGDLGVEANIYNLFHFEKVFIKQLELIEKPYLIAGQVLENMVKNSQPSRSEVSHLGYLIENGFSGVVLSDETAIGNYPVQAVEFCKHYFDFINRS